MRIYFISHGIAEAFASDDKRRGLTFEGRMRLEDTFSKFAKEFKKEGITDYRIFCSTYQRSMETAEILSEYLGEPYSIKQYLGGCTTKELMYRLELSRKKCYILISHEPYISNWIFELTGEDVIVSRGSIHKIDI